MKMSTYRLTPGYAKLSFLSHTFKVLIIYLLGFAVNPLRFVPLVKTTHSIYTVSITKFIITIV